MAPKRINCPTCGIPLSYESVSDITCFPFCSRRCRLIDFDKWVEGDYRISRDITDADVFEADIRNSIDEDEKP